MKAWVVVPGKIVAQLYSIRKFTSNRRDLESSLAKIKAIGYDRVQFSAVAAVEGDDADTSPREARAILDDNGLECVGAHSRWAALRDETEREIEFLEALGCGFVAVGSLADEYDPYEADSYSRFVDDSAAVIETLRSRDISFGYHNHAHEFMRSVPGGATYFDTLIDRGEEGLLMEFDVYWAAVAGVNPASIFERIHGRATYIHAKDVEMVLPDDGGRPAPFYAPVGEGNLDWDSIIPAARAAGTEFWIVEQDAARRDMFDCLRSSYEFLAQRID